MNLELSSNAIYLLEQRYLRKNEKREIIESPREMFVRVAHTIAEVERQYGATTDEVGKWEMKFMNQLTSLKFLPNSPTLFNAGTELGILSGCFCLPIHDSMESIMKTAKDSSIIFKHGGGCGYDFSNLRPKGDIVRKSSGVASGPISFMEIYDTVTNVIKQAGKRRGAMMAVLHYWHPDIMNFIGCKEKENNFTNFNISVGVDDEFMKAVEDDKWISLINPRTKKEVREVRARSIWNQILVMAWRNGEPGILFFDKINEENPTPELGEIRSVNPCSEQPLLPYESCNLGSINLGKFVKKGRTQWKDLEETIRIAVRFLDNVIDASDFPIEELYEMVEGNRKIGLGVMGWHDFLILKGMKYDTDEAIQMARDVMKFITRTARDESRKLGEEKGSFPNKDKSIYKDEEYMRNAALTTVAPTGCYSDDTKVLTENGWKLFKDLKKGEKVMTMNQESRELELQAPSKIFEYEYQGEMFNFKHRGIDLLVTPNHRMLVRSSPSHDNLLFREARNLHYPSVIPQKWKWKGEEKDTFILEKEEKEWVANNNLVHREWDEIEVDMDNFLRFLGYYLSEGSITKSKNNMVYITQTKDEQVKKNIENVLDKLGFPYFYASGSYQITSRQLHNYVEQFGEASDKFVPDFVKELTPRQIELFITSFLEGDGTKGRRELEISSERLANDLQELFIRTGKNASLRHRTRTMNTERSKGEYESTLYRVIERKSKTQWIRKRNVEIKEYSGKVHCVEVPNHTVLVKRNGFPVICGNSISIIADCSQGIEPLFALQYKRSVEDSLGKDLIEYPSIVEYLFKEYEAETIEELPKEIQKLLVTANEIDPEYHVRMQAAFQKYTDAGISKTVNLPNSATIYDIEKIYLLAYKLNCKGITVYRNGSREEQLLTKIDSHKCKGKICEL